MPSHPGVYAYFLCRLVCTCIHESVAELTCMCFSFYHIKLCFRLLYIIALMSNVYDACVCMCVCVCMCASACEVNLYCSAQLSMFNMEKRYRNKIIINIIIIRYGYLKVINL